jgi:iron complex outermembrane receptor protein
MVRRVLASLLLALVLIGPSAVQAQNAAGTVSGAIRDSLGGAIPGASIRIVNESTNVAAEVVSDAQGAYSVTDLEPGPYRLEVTLSGFETILRRFNLAPGASPIFDVSLVPSRLSEGIVVTARRMEEAAQEVPIPVSVVSGQQVAEAGVLNVGRVQELVPTVQFYSTNPRNTFVNIRGLGLPFGLTNDGVEPGVGMYVDGVFYARPASTTLDFLDVAQIEVLRGPQGTLFGKNTTAGAIVITSRRPSFTRETAVELSFGETGYVQAKGSITGPLGSKLAGRLSFSGTQRDGVVYNTKTGNYINDLNNLGFKGQLLYVPTEKLAITLSADNTRQRPQGYAQVLAGVAPTLRAANRQWPAIAADLNYAPPSYNPFDRVTDTDSPWRSTQDLRGSSLNVDWDLGRGRLTSTTAWRFWNWEPANDRDWTGLSVVALSQATSKHTQWTQEVRYAGDLTDSLGLVVGFFTFGQQLDTAPSHKTEAGKDAWRYSLTPSAAAATPGLLDGYGEDTVFDFHTTSSAVFSQLEWSITDRLRVLPGLRFNYDRKEIDFERSVYGGLQTTDPALIALQRSIYAPQAYKVDADDTNWSGQFSAAYKISNAVNSYATYSTSFKSIGLNLGGVPNDATGQPALAAATVRPEAVKHFEAGVKTEFRRGVIANFTAYNTNIRDYQVLVQNAQYGVQRGYLANAEKARVRGFEVDGSAAIGNALSLYGAVAWTDAKYIKFVDAPVPLEETGGPAPSKDISGEKLPGVSDWSGTLGLEVKGRSRLLGQAGELYGAIDTSLRTSYSSSPTPSQYLVVPGRGLVNARVGFRWTDGWSLSLWARNLLNHDYYETLQPGAGGSGLYTAQLGDPRSAGVTLRLSFR